MIEFLNLNKFKKNLIPITSGEFYIRPGEYHPEGLFSESIFGSEESVDRKRTFAYIDLNCFVVHPSAFTILKRLDRKIESFLSATKTFDLDDDNKLIEVENGVTGINEFIKMFPKINFRGGDPTREKFIEKIQQANKEKTLFIDIIPVIPPEYRKCFENERGQITCDPLNDYYVALIRKSSQISRIPKGSALHDLFNYEVQLAVIEHDNFIKKLIQKKSGIIRSQLLSKRTDFSGRAVITSDPELDVNQVGIPIRLAVKLFEPFLMHRLLNSGLTNTNLLSTEIEKFTGLKLSVDTIKSLFKAIHSGDKIPPTLEQIIFEACEAVVVNRYVLLKRDPALHAESVRGFNVKIVRGNTIHLSNYHTGGFNADYDGDTMAVYHPLTDEAQVEIKNKMMRSESGDNYKAVNFELSKDMVAGLYIITKEISRGNSPLKVTDEDLDKATDPYVNVIYRNQKTTMGRAIYNSAFPTDFPFQNKVIKKGDVNGLISVILTKYGQDQAVKTFSKLGKVGFKFATIMAPSLKLDTFDRIDEVEEIKARLGEVGADEGDLLIKKAQGIMIEKLKEKNDGVHDLVESGATKGWGQPTQMLVAKGVVADPQGKVLDPIKSSFGDGLTNEEYFKAAAGARRGIIDRVLNTSETGYLSRQLAYVLNSVEIDRHLVDCKTKRTLELRLEKTFEDKFNGRYVITDKGRVELFRKEDYQSGDIIHFRTPILCEAPKICHTCYGKLLERHRTPYAGILAAQIIGEAGTQTIMRTFHTGGAIKIVRKNMINDTIQNDPFLDATKIKNILTQTDNFLFAKQDLILTIDKEDYPFSDDVVVDVEENLIYIRSLVGGIQTNDYQFNIILDYPVIISFTDIDVIDKKLYKIKFSEGDRILETPMETDETKQQLRYAQRLMGGKEIYKDVNHLYLKLFRVYGTLRSMDSIHLEILLSQVLRDRLNTSIPARLGKKWDPVMMNIKKIVFKTSFIQGLEFENINEAIATGLITEEPDEQSVLEKILFGTLVDEDKKK